MRTTRLFENEGMNIVSSVRETIHILTRGILQDLVVNGKYRIDYKVGQGGCGLVYAGNYLYPHQLQ